jgi:hypothetical protein
MGSVRELNIPMPLALKLSTRIHPFIAVGIQIPAVVSALKWLSGIPPLGWLECVVSA